MLSLMENQLLVSEPPGPLQAGMGDHPGSLGSTRSLPPGHQLGSKEQGSGTRGSPSPCLDSRPLPPLPS